MQATGRTRPEPEEEASRLYHEYYDKILRYCVGQLRSREEAEDAVQNTFLRVFTALRKGVAPEFEGPWLYKIAHNVCLSRRLGSSRRSRVETPSDLDMLGERAAAYSADTDELFGLDDALADMPANLRRPLLMREWQGMSYAEIAEALGVSHSAVETLIFRARRHLASALTDSVKKSGRAIASVFNLRWLFEAVKGLGGGVGGAGMAAGAAGLVVAIGGGVAIDLGTQHSSPSHAAVGTDAASPAGVRASPIASLKSSRPGANGAQGVARLNRGDGAGGSAPGARTGASGRHHGSGSGGASSAGGAAKPSAGAAASASGSTTGSGSAGRSSRSGGAAAGGSSGARSPTKPKTSGGRLPIPGLTPPPAPIPPSGNPGGVPPVPPVPPLPTAPKLPPPPSIKPPALPPPPAINPPALPPPPPLPAPPTITVPGNLTAEATGPLGVVVSYTVTATDSGGGSIPVTCTPASGSTFTLGHTNVSCSATDRHGSTGHANFDVLVRDTTPPALTVPSDISVQTSLKSGAKVTFTATATDLVDSAPKVSCSPASGSVFLVRTTTVTCTATDSSGNSTSKSFHVTVTLVLPVPAPPLPPPPPLSPVGTPAHEALS